MNNEHWRQAIIICWMIIFGSMGFASSQEQQDPFKMNGGSVLAMAGDQCVALAVDKRFGSGPQMVNIATRKVLMPHPKLIVAFTGLESHAQSLMQELKVQSRKRQSLLLSQLPDHAISPKAMSTLMSHILWERKYYVEPVVVGLTPAHADGGSKPFLCAQDMIGAQSKSDAFVCAGVATSSMFGIAEALWRPNLSKEELIQVCGKAFLSALERDCLSGYGAVLYLISKDGIEQIDLVTGND